MTDNENMHVAETDEFDGKTKFLAFLCSICPFCIAARFFPNSGYAKALKKAEKDCPACRAYARVKGLKTPVETDNTDKM
jgi:rubrerythrin